MRYRPDLAESTQREMPEWVKEFMRARNEHTRETAEEQLPFPFEDFFLEWIPIDTPTPTYRWRCSLHWRLGPWMGPCFDGFSKRQLRIAMMAIAEHEFPGGKPKKS